MNVYTFRKLKLVYINSNIVSIHNSHISSSNKTINNTNVKNDSNVKKIKKNKKNISRKIFRREFAKYIYSYVNKFENIKVKSKYDELRIVSACSIYRNICRDYFKLSKRIMKVYRLNGTKITKVESDTILLNMTKAYINTTLNTKIKYKDSLFNIYSIYNYMIDDIDYDYINYFNNIISHDIDKLRDRFAIKYDLKTPEYLSDKIGKGRKDIFKLAFKLVTTSDEITCDVPRKKYLEVCDNKEDFIEIYEMLGKGIKRYMKYFDISPLFKIFMSSINKKYLSDTFGYTGYALSEKAYIGMYALLFTQMILNTYGTNKGILSMMKSPSSLYRDFVRTSKYDLDII